SCLNGGQHGPSKPPVNAPMGARPLFINWPICVEQMCSLHWVFWSLVGKRKDQRLLGAAGAGAAGGAASGGTAGAAGAAGTWAHDRLVTPTSSTRPAPHVFHCIMVPVLINSLAGCGAARQTDIPAPAGACGPAARQTVIRLLTLCRSAMKFGCARGVA